MTTFRDTDLPVFTRVSEFAKASTGADFVNAQPSVVSGLFIAERRGHHGIPCVFAVRIDGRVKLAWAPKEGDKLDEPMMAAQAMRDRMATMTAQVWGESLTLSLAMQAWMSGQFDTLDGLAPDSVRASTGNDVLVYQGTKTVAVARLTGDERDGSGWLFGNGGTDRSMHTVFTYPDYEPFGGWLVVDHIAAYSDGTVYRHQPGERPEAIPTVDTSPARVSLALLVAAGLSESEASRLAPDFVKDHLGNLRAGLAWRTPVLALVNWAMTKGAWLPGDVMALVWQSGTYSACRGGIMAWENLPCTGENGHLLRSDTSYRRTKGDHRVPAALLPFQSSRPDRLADADPSMGGRGYVGDHDLRDPRTGNEYASCVAAFDAGYTWALTNADGIPLYVFKTLAAADEWAQGLDGNTDTRHLTPFGVAG